MTLFSETSTFNGGGGRLFTIYFLISFDAPGGLMLSCSATHGVILSTLTCTASLPLVGKPEPRVRGELPVPSHQQLWTHPVFASCLGCFCTFSCSRFYGYRKSVSFTLLFFKNEESSHEVFWNMRCLQLKDEEREIPGIPFPIKCCPLPPLPSVALCAVLRTLHCGLSMFVRAECFDWGFASMLCFLFLLIISILLDVTVCFLVNTIIFPFRLLPVLWHFWLMSMNKTRLGRFPFQNTAPVISVLPPVPGLLQLNRAFTTNLSFIRIYTTSFIRDLHLLNAVKVNVLPGRLHLKHFVAKGKYFILEAFKIIVAFIIIL